MSDEEQRVGDLEIHQDLEFQRRIWAVQRIGWVLMAAVIILALLGFIGPGMFNQSSAGSREARISIDEYERFLRFMKPTTLRVRLNSPSGREARVWVDRKYLQNVQVQQVTPEPERVKAGTDRMVYVFDVADPGQPTAVTFNLQPQKIGSLQGRAGLEGGRSLSFKQFVYP